MKIFFLTIPLVVIMAFGANADANKHGHTSKYAGQENRAVKSLSPDDIAELRRGGGWGLARAAELNGVPGPAHLLELKEKIPLDATQVTAITDLFNEMKAKAIHQGETLIALEQALEDHFRDRTITDNILRTSLNAISKARNELRYIHLATHLKTPEILNEHQIGRYNQLRGYGSADPCANPPKGHDVEMWRKHNGCK
jgi:hypothetical protein